MFLNKNWKFYYPGEVEQAEEEQPGVGQESNDDVIYDGDLNLGDRETTVNPCGLTFSIGDQVTLSIQIDDAAPIIATSTIRTDIDLINFVVLWEYVMTPEAEYKKRIILMCRQVLGTEKYQFDTIVWGSDDLHAEPQTAHFLIKPYTKPQNSLSKNYTDNVDAEKTYAPVTNVEKYFAAMAGDEIEMPTPRNAMEYQMKRAAENIQNGSSGGGGAFVVHSDDRGNLDKTWQEIHDEFVVNPSVYLILVSGTDIIMYPCFILIIDEGKGYGIQFYDYLKPGLITYTCVSPSDYPQVSI